MHAFIPFFFLLSMVRKDMCTYAWLIVTNGRNLPTRTCLIQNSMFLPESMHTCPSNTHEKAPSEGRWDWDHPPLRAYICLHGSCSLNGRSRPFVGVTLLIGAWPHAHLLFDRKTCIMTWAYRAQLSHECNAGDLRMLASHPNESNHPSRKHACFVLFHIDLFSFYFVLRDHVTKCTWNIFLSGEQWLTYTTLSFEIFLKKLTRKNLRI